MIVWVNFRDEGKEEPKKNQRGGKFYHKKNGYESKCKYKWILCVVVKIAKRNGMWKKE